VSERGPQRSRQRSGDKRCKRASLLVAETEGRGRGALGRPRDCAMPAAAEGTEGCGDSPAAAATAGDGA
jgi:hypothetical protein